MTTACSSPSQPSRTGWRPGGKRAVQELASRYLDWALSDFSGYIAADELYDGPFCVLSIVDNRTFKRLAYEVLDRRVPTRDDVRAFFERFQSALQQRGLSVRAITTDGSTLYPEPIAQVFGAIPHQLCVFHILKQLTKVVLRAVAQVRKRLAARKPKLPKGRPKKEAAELVEKQRRSQEKISELFEHRHLFVRHHLKASEKKTLQRLCHYQPQLRTLRSIMDEVYCLFDRRCRTDTALAKLARLRQRVRQFMELGRILNNLFSSNLEKALTFLDDRFLPSTSNAVERGNRRHRKMQKTIYRVRTREHISCRIALDVFRDARKQKRDQTRYTLHEARAG